MPKRKQKRSSRLSLPWEAGDNPFAGLLSRKKVWPLVTLVLGAAFLVLSFWVGGRRAEIRTTRATLAEVERATHDFLMDMGRCPRNTAELVHPPKSGVHYLSRTPVDAWGRAIYLRCSHADHSRVEVLSAGPSGSFLDDDNVM